MSDEKVGECGPVSQPLKTWDALVSWQQDKDPACVATVLLPEDAARESRAQVLVCHDMAGGYLEDRFVQGVDTASAYRFYHWQHVDTFVYFSHYFVTIPPPGWTNAAHKHGTRMLGTVITEWDEGKERCERFLESSESVSIFVKQLVAIASYYKFDGWLVNIENPIKPELVERLRDFLGQLTNQMHAAQPHFQVIWYDSVTCQGQLKWQDELNDLNSCYFDLCDGIFLNYNWKADTLRQSSELARSKGRLHDVYVGVDVFGRGCLGGGGFNTIEALEAIAVDDLSVAIFAQGWVYEKMGKENFIENENKFWQLLHGHLPKRSVTQLPLWTTFCQGLGKKNFTQGKMSLDTPWFNLSRQCLQPTTTAHCLSLEAPPGGCQCMQWKEDDAYSGGSCLQLTGKLPPEKHSLNYRLFHTNLKVSGQLMVAYTFKMLSSSTEVALEIRETAETGTRQLLLGSGCSNSTKDCVHENGAACNPQSMTQSNVDILCSGYELPLAINGWTTRVYEISASGTITSVSVDLESRGDNKQVDVLLGQMMIFQKQALSDRPTVENVQFSHQSVVKGKADLLFSCVLKWEAGKIKASHYIIYYQYDVDEDDETSTKKRKKESDSGNDLKFLGVSYSSVYYTPKLSLPRSATDLTFVIQPISAFGLPVTMETLPQFTVNLQ